MMAQRPGEAAIARQVDGKAVLLPMIRSKWQLAYDAFHRTLPELLRQGFGGQWVLYDGPERLRISANRDELYQLAEERGLPGEEIFVDLISPEPEDIDAEIMLYR